ncbi:hexokinase HKDC1-like [Neosynchiropus ocellatus]
MLAVHIFSYFFTKLQEDPTKKVDRFLYRMRLHDDQLQDISARFQAEMKKGLCAESNPVATVKMLPTHVRSTPDGSEKGEFLALDLGGSRFKVLRVDVREARGMRPAAVEIEEATYPISNDVLIGKGTEVFDYVSESLKDFLQKKNMDLKKKHPLAFTFSFPCEHAAINKGVLLNWGKIFRARGLKGKEVVQALKDAIERTEDLDVEVVALVNDSVATMMSCGFDDRNCQIGLIIGTGTNACYMEEMRHIGRVPGDEGRMCVNTEWGAFGDDGALDDFITEFDREVDAASINPGKQLFEKMVSGMHQGELVRLIVLKMAKEGWLFDGHVSEALMAHGKITSAHVAAMEEYKTGLKNTRDILTDLGLHPSSDDCVAVQHVSTIVSFRSSNLVAAALSAILARVKANRNVGKLKISVGVDGTVYRTHPRYSKRLHKVLQRLIPECHVRFIQSNCGSSKGAALVAAVGQRLASQRRQIDEKLSTFELSLEQLQAVKTRMRADMEAGLTRKQLSAVKMLPTYVCGLPDGSESGRYLALDLGENSFKVLLVNLRRGQHLNSGLHQKIYSVPSTVMRGTSEELFDHLAECIGDFLDNMGLKSCRLPAGFSFPFPYEQTAVDSGTLVSWTKGFQVSDCDGRDVIQMLKEAVERRSDFELDIAAVVNDTVGTMMCCASEDPQCEIGLIIGAGTNICYMEDVKNIKTIDRVKGRAEKEEGTPGERFESGETLKMCINTECCGLGDDGSLSDIITQYDLEVDQTSLNTGKQTLEKLTSGMYLGEIVRQVLLDLTREGLLFRGRVTDRLKTPGIFDTKLLSKIESDRLAVLQVRCVLQQLGLDCNCDDSGIVKEVCAAVSRRAARLCGAVLAAVVDKIRETRGQDRLDISVGVDGALYKLHPHFSRVLRESTGVLAPRCSVTFLPSDEGSGKGAALVTVLTRQK